jgi:hypothetical protein
MRAPDSKTRLTLTCAMSVLCHALARNPSPGRVAALGARVRIRAHAARWLNSAITGHQARTDRAGDATDFGSVAAIVSRDVLLRRCRDREHAGYFPTRRRLHQKLIHQEAGRLGRLAGRPDRKLAAIYVIAIGPLDWSSVISVGPPQGNCGRLDPAICVLDPAVDKEGPGRREGAKRTQG